MGPRHRDPGVLIHQLAKQLCVFDQADAAPLGFQDFRVIRSDRRRNHGKITLFRDRVMRLFERDVNPVLSQ